MKISFKNKADVAQFVENRLRTLKTGSVLTMIIQRDTSEESFVLTVTGALSDATAANQAQASS